MKCLRCGEEMEEAPGKWDHNLAVRSGTFTRKRAELYVCKKCGFLEFHLKE